MVKIDRPKIISIVCAAGMVRFLVLFALIASPEIKRLGGLYPVAFGFIAATQFISMVGVWYMKKWGVHMFTVCFFVKLMLLVVINDLEMWTWIGVVFSILYLTTFLFYYKKMDENL